ncbi:MAG: sialate O-acetylesterase [Prevotella sp.]
MVLQRNAILRLDGSATPNVTVSVKPSWTNKVFTAISDASGKFSVDVATPEAGGPFYMTVEAGKDRVVLGNILSGEVWLCSGQSNMELQVKGDRLSAMDWEKVVATAQHPEIRLLKIPQQKSFVPLNDCAVSNEGWVECNSSSVAHISAIAYFYACELSDSLRVPIGIMDVTRGGTKVEAWASLKSIRSVPGYEWESRDLELYASDYNKIMSDYRKLFAKWSKKADDKMNHPIENAPHGKMPTGITWQKTVLPSTFSGIVRVTKKINVTKAMEGKNVTLHLGKFKSKDVTSFNGVIIGSESRGEIRRVYTVPGEMVKEGVSEIECIITCYGSRGGFNGGDIMRAVYGSDSISLADDWDYEVIADFSDIYPIPISPDQYSFPTVLYNAMIHPLAHFPVKGVLWYQGEDNVTWPKPYEKMFKCVIRDWRELWQKPDMPFYFVQLAGYGHPSFCQPESMRAELRHAQAKALSLPNTEMATAIDLGNPVDIHPRDKQDVAHRLALIALGREYGKQVEWQSPKLENIKMEKGHVLLSFNQDIRPTSVAVTGFIIAGKDGHFVQAQGRQLNARTIELFSLLVPEPKIVRYDWADYPNGNVYNMNGLPLAPFATDK